MVRFHYKLLEYDYNIEHKAGKLNTNADALSRTNNFELKNSKVTEKKKILYVAKWKLDKKLVKLVI